MQSMQEGDAEKMQHLNVLTKDALPTRRGESDKKKEWKRSTLEGEGPNISIEQGKREAERVPVFRNHQDKHIEELLVRDFSNLTPKECWECKQCAALKASFEGIIDFISSEHMM